MNTILKFLSFGLLLVAVGGASTRNPDWADCLNDDVDAYLDKVLDSAKKQISDPMRLPPRSGFVELSEGRVWGISNLVRSGPATVTCEDEKTVVVKAKITTDEIKARYRWDKEITRKPRTGHVLVISDDFQAEIELHIYKGEDGSHPRLTSFEINRFKDLRVEMTGLGFLTWALGEWTTLMSSVLQGAVARAVQGPLREALERELAEISIS